MNLILPRRRLWLPDWLEDLLHPAEFPLRYDSATKGLLRQGTTGSGTGKLVNDCCAPSISVTISGMSGCSKRQFVPDNPGYCWRSEAWTNGTWTAYIDNAYACPGESWSAEDCFYYFQEYPSHHGGFWRKFSYTPRSDPPEDCYYEQQDNDTTVHWCFSWKPSSAGSLTGKWRAYGMFPLGSTANMVFSGESADGKSKADTVTITNTITGCPDNPYSPDADGVINSGSLTITPNSQ